MSFGKSKSKQSSNSQSSQTIDPGILGTLNQNIADTRAIARQPYQPYTGQVGAGTTGATKSAIAGANGLLGFEAPDISASTYDPTTGTAASIDRSQIGNVNAGLLSDIDLSAYLNPHTREVIDAASADNERARLMARMADEDAAGAAGAFGGSRHGVADSLTNEAYDRTSAATAAQLRQAGFDTALSAAGSDLTRQLQADLANQGVDLGVATENAGLLQGMNLANLGFKNTAGQFNATQRQNADLANQGAAIDSAGVRTGAVGLLGDIGAREREAQQAALDRQYQQHMDQQQWPITMQQLLNQSIGLLPNPVLSNSSSTSKGSSWGMNAAFKSA